MIDRERFWTGDPTYAEELVRRFGPMVLMVARAYRGDLDHAEDLFQEIWMHAFKKRRSYDGRGSFEGWLHRLATNVCIGEYRGRKARSSALGRFAREGQGEERGWKPLDPLAGTEREELHLRLHRALRHLSEREHEAVTLRIIEGHAPEDVARIMGLEKASVRSHIRHAIRRLRSILEDPGDELSRHESSG